MASRTQSFIRGFYTNAQNQSINGLVRRSGAEVLSSVDHQSKRKRTDDDTPSSPSATTAFGSPLPGSGFLSNKDTAPFLAEGCALASDAELSSFLFDDNNKCIFEEDGMAPPAVAVTGISNNMKRCRLGSSSGMKVQVASEAVADLMQVKMPSPMADIVGTVPISKVKVKANMHKPPARKRTHKERVKKNSRERIRRAGMGSKFKELYDLVCSGMVASVITVPASSTVEQAEMERLRKAKIAKPSKVLVLSEAIKTIRNLEKELADLKRLSNQQQ